MVARMVARLSRYKFSARPRECALRSLRRGRDRAHRRRSNAHLRKRRARKERYVTSDECEEGEDRGASEVREQTLVAGVVEVDVVERIGALVLEVRHIRLRLERGRPGREQLFGPERLRRRGGVAATPRGAAWIFRGEGRGDAAGCRVDIPRRRSRRRRGVPRGYSARAVLSKLRQW